jgi:Rrf2 family protein
MQLTRAADYAVRVMIHLAGRPFGTRVTRDELSVSGSVPEHFLSKILQSLSRGGLITSHRGMAGGYSLAKDPETVSLLDVVEVMEGPLLLNVCLAPGLSCDRKSWCSVHLVWVDAQEALAKVLRGATIAALARESAGNEQACGGGPWT